MKRHPILAAALTLLMLPLSCCSSSVPKIHSGATLAVDLSTAYHSEPFKLRGGSLSPACAVSTGLIASKTVKGKERYYLYRTDTDEFTEFQGRRKETPSYAGELPDGRFIFLYNDSVGRESGLDVGDGTHRSAEIYDAKANLMETFQLPSDMPAGYISPSTIAMDGDGRWVFIGNSDTHFTVRSGEAKADDGWATGYYVLEPDFSLKGELALNGSQPVSFIKGASGTLYGVSGAFGKGITLARLDCEAMTAEPLEHAVPSSARCLMTGREQELFYSLDDGIYAWDPAQGASIVVDYVNSDLSDADCGWISYSLPDGTFLVMYTDYDSDQSDFYRLTPRTEEENSAVQIVSLAGVNLNRRLVKDVIAYNKSQNETRIVMKDYGKEMVLASDDAELRKEYELAQQQWRDPDIDFSPAIEKFKSDLLTGTVPDIVCMDAMPYQILSNKGILCDLLPLLREDARFDESLYMDNILDGLKRGERLERIGFSFTVDTMAAKTKFVGSQQQHSAEEYLAMLQQTPETMQYLPFNTREELTYTFLVKTQGAFIDKDALTCTFDQPTFVDLLKMVSSVQPAEEKFTDDKTFSDAIEYGYNYSEDHTLLCPFLFSRPLEYHQIHFQDFRQADITLVGFPQSGDGNGGMFRTDYTISLTSQSACSAQVLDFITTQLSPRRQSKFCIESWNSASFPIMREMLENSMLGASRGYHAGGNMTVQEIDEFKDYLAHVTVYEETDPAVTSIILEEAGKYFAGDCTAEHAAGTIQSRVRLYLTEQY